MWELPLVEILRGQVLEGGEVDGQRRWSNEEKNQFHDRGSIPFNQIANALHIPAHPRPCWVITREHPHPNPMLQPRPGTTRYRAHWGSVQRGSKTHKIHARFVPLLIHILSISSQRLSERRSRMQWLSEEQSPY